MLLDALMNMDREQLRAARGAAVARFAGMEPGRPVGGAYYLYRTLRQLDAEGLVGKMMEQARSRTSVGEGAFDERLAREEFEGRLKVLKELIEAEIRRAARRRPRRRGDGAHAAQAAARRRRLHARVARGDAAAAAGDLPADARARGAARAAAPAPAPRHARLPPDRARTRCRTAACPPSRSSSGPRPSKPEIMVVADISGSVASFARFTLQFVYAMQSEFSKVRSWVFIDGVDEVTRFFDESDDIADADPPRQHRSRRRVGRRPLRLRPRVRGVARTPHPRGHAEVVDHPARRRPQQLPRVAGVDARRDAQARPARCSGSTPSRAATGTPATRSSPSTRRTATASTSAATSASSSSSSPRSPKAEEPHGAMGEYHRCRRCAHVLRGARRRRRVAREAAARRAVEQRSTRGARRTALAEHYARRSCRRGCARPSPRSWRIARVDDRIAAATVLPRCERAGVVVPVVARGW